MGWCAVLPLAARLEPVREPSQRLTQHKRLGSRSLAALWGREEAPALLFKGSKPEAVTAGWGLFFVPSHLLVTAAAPRVYVILSRDDA